MALSPGLAKELLRELKALQHSRAEADARIQAIELLLASEATMSHDQRKQGRERGKIKVPVERGHSAKRPPLRDVVLQAMLESPGTSVTATELAERIKGAGVRVNGKTSLRDRVVDQLLRLKRSGVVRKYRNGHYAPHVVEPAAIEAPVGHDSQRIEE